MIKYSRRNITGADDAWSQNLMKLQVTAPASSCGTVQVHNSTISRALSDRGAPVGTVTDVPPASELEWESDTDTDTDADTDIGTDTDIDTDAGVEVAGPAGARNKAGQGNAVSPRVAVPASGARIGEGSFASRYSGAMLLHAFTDLVGASSVLGSAAQPVSGRRFDDVAMLTAICTVFTLGFASIEQAKYPDRAQVGPLAGIDVLPELRTLRPRLAALADGYDPLGLQRAFATAMLAARSPSVGCWPRPRCCARWASRPRSPVPCGAKSIRPEP
jgi:hypothetical protein